MSADRLPTSVLVHIQGEPFLSRAREYIAAHHAWRLAWSAFAQSRGAEGHSYGDGGLNFGYRNAPQGWTKPSGKNGWSRPKRSHADVQVIKDLPRCPSAWPIFRDHFIDTISYKSNDCEGWSTVARGHWNAADMGWISDDLLYARVPHPANAAANHLAQYPDHTITTPGAVGWKMPAGLTEVSQAQVDLWHAQAALDDEKASLSPAPSTSLEPA